MIVFPSCDLVTTFLACQLYSGKLHLAPTIGQMKNELVGGAGFFRNHPVERIVRDIRALHFHPLPERIQQTFSGRLALGMEPIEA